MEKVTDLFKAFRNNEIAYDELFGSLTRMLSEDPHFATQAIVTLDNAQQLTPIPVTDFIQLRGQLENTAETFQQQGADSAPSGADSTDSTKVFDADEQTHRPDPGMAGAYDPTMIASSAETTGPGPQPAAAPTNTPVENSDYQDEATVIMPMPPRQQATSAPTPSAEPSDLPTAEEYDDHATLIAPAASSAEPSPVPPPPPTQTSEPSAPAPAPTPSPTQKDKKLPVPLLAGLGAVALLVILVVTLWPGEEPASGIADSPSEVAADPWQNTPSTTAPPTTATSETAPKDDLQPDSGEPLMEEPAYTEPAYTKPENGDSEAPEPAAIGMKESEQDTLAEETMLNENNSMSVDAAPAPSPSEPEVKDEAYFMVQVEKAVAANRLTPSQQEGTATYYLVELIRYNRDSDMVSEARTLISKRHLELAKSAREKGEWDSAQQHLDDALKVRLPDSYLP